MTELWEAVASSSKPRPLSGEALLSYETKGKPDPTLGKHDKPSMVKGYPQTPSFAHVQLRETRERVKRGQEPWRGKARQGQGKER